MIVLGATIGGVALAAVGAFVVWRQRGVAAPGQAIQLVASRYLGGKRFVTLVEVDGERLLLGLSGDTVSLVARLGTRSPEPTSTGPVGDA